MYSSQQTLQDFIINNSNKGLEQATLTISQLLIHNSMKRVRQNRRNTKTQRAKSRESRLGIYLGMMIHANTRKRTLVDKLYSFGISVSYSRVMELPTKMGNKVFKSLCRTTMVLLLLVIQIITQVLQRRKIPFIHYSMYHYSSTKLVNIMDQIKTFLHKCLETKSYEVFLTPILIFDQSQDSTIVRKQQTIQQLTWTLMT